MVIAHLNHEQAFQVTRNHKTSYGSWVVQDLIASGGMGTTFKATRSFDILGNSLEQSSALKLTLDESPSPDTLARFVGEMQLLARAGSPYIANFIDAGVESGELWFAQQFIDGPNLQELIEIQPLSEYVWENLAIHCMLGLQAAHTENVSHLDLKPSNIMFANKTGTFVMIDFGIAKVQSSSGTNVGNFEGTMIYTAPEQFNGTPFLQSDIWSLGVVLFEAATGVHPLYSQFSDFNDFNPKAKSESFRAFLSAPSPDWSLIKDESHRQLVQKMIVTKYQSRGSLSVLVNELRSSQGYRQPVIALGGLAIPMSQQPTYWKDVNKSLTNSISAHEHWGLIRASLAELLRQKGSKHAAIAIDLQDPEAIDLDIHFELYDGGKILQITAPEPHRSGLAKALSLGWKAGKYPSQICKTISGSSDFDEIADEIASLLEISFQLKATKIRIF